MPSKRSTASRRSAKTRLRGCARWPEKSRHDLFGDYRAVDGVQEPQRIRIRRGGETLELAVQKAAHNASLEATLFDFPRRDARPLPDIATLFKQVMDSQQALEKAREDYAYTKTETDTEIDDAGHIKDKSERTYEGFYLAGKEIEKLVARNGQPLRDDEARKEQARIEKQIRFEPRPGEKPRSRAESWMQKLSGNLWIDEHAKGIVRAEARVNDAIKMGGGLLVSLHRGSSFVFEQELVKGEVWLPSYAEVNASARLLLVKGYKINQQMRFSDYKKFNVESSSEIKPPKP